jgi:hypothetical protein
LDWYAIVGMILLASLLAFLNFRKSRQSPDVKSQKWKPAWQKLQWCNTERERLEAENVSLKKELVAVKTADSENQLGSLSFSPLQVRVFGIAKELQQFKNNFEPCPRITQFDGSQESFERHIHDNRVLLEPWQERLGHAYASIFSRKVTDLIHELGAQGFDVSGLEPYGKWVGSIDNVNNASKALWKLAEDMEFK